MHEYDYQLPPQALWEWDEGQSMYPPNADQPMIIHRGADCDYTPKLETEDTGGGTIRLTIRERGGRQIWQADLASATDTVTVPASVTKDMRESRDRYFFDIMLVGVEERRSLQSITPVWVYPTAGGVQYDRRG